MFPIKYSRRPTNLRRQCASNAGIRLWNALSDDITNISSIHLFKRYIKSSYLHCYQTNVLGFIIC